MMESEKEKKHVLLHDKWFIINTVFALVSGFLLVIVMKWCL